MPVGYGMSETASFFTGLPVDHAARRVPDGSYGRLLPGNELRVVDPETGRGARPRRRRASCIVRGPTLMEHYVKRTRAECFDADGFYHTGDVGSYDDDGYVYWAGRRTEMIKTAGANVVAGRDRGAAAARTSRSSWHGSSASPMTRRDEIVVLCVELQDGATATEDDIKAFLRERVAELQGAEARPVLRRRRDPDERQRYQGPNRPAAGHRAGAVGA